MKSHNQASVNLRWTAPRVGTILRFPKILSILLFRNGTKVPSPGIESSKFRYCSSEQFTFVGHIIYKFINMGTFMSGASSSVVSCDKEMLKMGETIEGLSLFVRRLRTDLQRPRNIAGAAGVLILLAAAVFFPACGGSSGSSSTVPPPVPSIQNVNNSTDPSSPINLPIEINGSGFQSAPGKVVFSQASSGITATVTPNAGGWTDTGIVVTVPAGDGTNQFTLPGTVTVKVTTSGGSSNEKTLTLVQTLTFNVNNVTWATTTALPSPLGGLSAAAVPVSDTSAFVVVAGGFNGVNNFTTVYCNTLATDGTVGPSWTNIPTNPLPASRAYAAMVEADPGNSLVPTGSRYVYVLGGQANAADAPGGTATVYMASVDTNSGAVGSWTQLTSSLPQTLVGPAAALFNGYIYVVGGLRSDGTPSPYVYSAPVNSDGTLGTWTTSPNSYPMGISFATAFGFAGKLYVLGGDIANSTTPNQQGTLGTGTTTVNFASARNGVVGAWSPTSATIKNRKKHITWTAFGQVIDAEGIYSGGTTGALELERSVIQSDSTLASWNGITASVNQINANVYNAAAIVSPLQSPTATPRFLLLGGQTVSALPAGVPSAKVYYNNAP
jgi:hypothetical protein